MPFHRLVVPTYFGGLPGGYDYINNAGAGTPSPVDVAKASGPNAGTYFHAFGEDGTSKNANRPAQALAQNTDYLDDLLHRDLALVAATAAIEHVDPVSLIVLPGPGIFLGALGTPDTAAGINTFIKILDADDKEIIDETKTHCMATALTGGTVGSGLFSAGDVSLTITPPIPGGVSYRVYYGTRGNLAELPVDAITALKIRAAETVSSLLEGLDGASFIGYTTGPDWLDATPNPAATVQDQLDKVVADLVDDAASKVGAPAAASSPYTLSAGPLADQIATMLSISASLRQDTTTLQSWLTPVASIAALKALTALTDGDLRVVTGVGFFRYGAASVAAEFLPFVVAPNAGSGRWLKVDGSAVVNGAAAFPPFETARTVARHLAMIPFSLTAGWNWGGGLSLFEHVLIGPATTAALAFPFEPHDGATLLSLDVYIRVAGAHANVPAVLPNVNVIREAMNLGGATTTAVGLRFEGPVAFPTPASGVAWDAGQSVQRWTFTANQNNVIDRAVYKYRIRLEDESGANSVAGNDFVGMIVNYGAVADMRFA